jgi:hypothetical protein
MSLTDRFTPTKPVLEVVSQLLRASESKLRGIRLPFVPGGASMDCSDHL